MTGSEKKAILGRIKWETTFDHIENSDLIIEAVAEDFDLKVKDFYDKEWHKFGDNIQKEDSP